VGGKGGKQDNARGNKGVLASQRFHREAIMKKAKIRKKERGRVRVQYQAREGIKREEE
jgi:hypothetical protein